jgi:hypothetical protein
MSDEGEVTRQYWLWVTSKKYYQEEDDTDSKALDPDGEAWKDSGWTCHEDTRNGDLVLLYRTTPKKDIGYLVRAESDAYFDDENEEGWDYWCDYRPLLKFRNPITISDLRDHPTLQEWGALRRNFQGAGGVHEIPIGIWDKLICLASDREPTLKGVIQELSKPPLPLSEKELESYLLGNMELFQSVGYDLELYISLDRKVDGHQFHCKDNGGVIDLLCRDRKKGGYVVVELKMTRARKETFGQVCDYMGWVQDNLVSGTAVEGLVISKSPDTKFKSCLKITDRVKHVSLKELFREAPVKRSRRGEGLWHKLKAIVD